MLYPYVMVYRYTPKLYPYVIPLCYGIPVYPYVIPLSYGIPLCYTPMLYPYVIPLCYGIPSLCLTLRVQDPSTANLGLQLAALQTSSKDVERGLRHQLSEVRG